VLAIRRPGSTLRSKIGHVRLHVADSLLMLVPEDRLNELRTSEDLIIVSELNVSLRRERFWWLPFALLPAAIALAALGVVDIGLGAPIAAIALLVFGVLTPQQAYRSVDWTVLFLIAAFIPIGQAVVTTGTAELLASGLISIAGQFPPAAMPYVVLALLYLGTSLLTEVISNTAAAVILVPIALSLGPELGVDSRPFVVAVCFAASAAFMTPMGYQTNLMVYGPGGYRFVDYPRFGLPLNLLFWVLATALIPRFWQF
jgi:di/tricarboxylate transporter